MVDMAISRRRSAIALSLLYATAGILHLALPGPFLSITPEWVPWPGDVILLTGVCEILGAIGLWVPHLRRSAGIALAAYAICVYPANIKHVIESLAGGSGTSLQWAYHLVRLPLQPFLVWLALFAAGVIRWPLRKKLSEEREART